MRTPDPAAKLNVADDRPLTSSLSAETDPAAHARWREAYGKLPLYFEANEGQLDRRVKFFSRGSGSALFLTPTEAVLALRSDEPPAASGANGADERGDGRSPSRTDRSSSSGQAVLRMRLLGANRAAEVKGLEQLSARINYYVGEDPARWRTGVPTFARVQYRHVYPGTDLVYYGNQRQFEYDFRLAPGADPSKIRLSFGGVSNLEVDEAGDLILRMAGGQVRQHRPVIYQELDGVKKEVAGGYLVSAKREVSFVVGEYDKARELIIDPTLDPALVYSTYLGGSDDDFGNGIAVDASDNAYVTGQTKSADFPSAPNPQGWKGSATNIFVTKFNAAGEALLYTTFFGTDGSTGCCNEGKAITVDSVGNAYVTGGYTGGSFGKKVFVAKLDPTTGAGLCRYHRRQPQWDCCRNGHRRRFSR